MRRFVLVAAALLLVVPGAAEAGKKKKKKDKNAPPPAGWVKDEGQTRACFYPKNYAELGPGDRKLARMQALNAMMMQWRGERNDGVKFGDNNVTHFETVMLGKPELIEQVSQQNLEECLASLKSGNTSGWGNWLVSTPAKLTEGECRTPPLDYQLFDYLNIGTDWQIPAPVCKKDKIYIKASAMDYYQITEDGPWINAEGDKDSPASGDLPCNIEGCFKGQLIVKFTTESNVVTVMPVGLEWSWEVPEHGTIHVMINDDTWYDNKFKVEAGLEHHTSIEYGPRK